MKHIIRKTVQGQVTDIPLDSLTRDQILRYWKLAEVQPEVYQRLEIEDLMDPLEAA